MGRILNFVFARDSFQIAVKQSVLELVAQLGSTVRSPRQAHPPGDSSYKGEVDESGFTIQRVATHGKDTRAAVVVCGRFRPQGEITAVQVTVRHGRHMVFFSWLLLLLASAAVVGAATGTLGNASSSSGWAGGALIAGMAALWHYRLYRNVRGVGAEVRTLLGHQGAIEDSRAEQSR